MVIALDYLKTVDDKVGNNHIVDDLNTINNVASPPQVYKLYKGALGRVNLRTQALNIEYFALS